MILSLFSLLVTVALPVVVVVLVVRQVSARQSGAVVGDGHGARRFFQYLLLYGLLVVVAVGLADLLALLDAEPALVDRDGPLARSLAFVVVGAPILLALAVWTRRRLRSDPAEVASLGWTAYLTIAGLTAVALTATAVHDVVGAALGGSLDLGALLRGLVWAAVWVGHRLLADRTLTAPRQLAWVLLGSLLGWLLSVVGLVGLLAAALDRLLVDAPGLIVGSGSGLTTSGAVLAAGGTVWATHWPRRLAVAPTSAWWLGYVLPVGVGVSLVVTVVGASVLLYRVLVWFLGTPGTSDPDVWVHGSTTAVGAALVGALSWWYHRQVLARRASTERTEVTRVHEYLLAGVALLAAAAGVALVVVAAIEAFAPAGTELVGGSVVNAVLAAVTLLVVGGPLWWTFWRRVQRVSAADPSGEASAPTRRIYLVLLFGVAGVTAVVTVIVAAFVLIEAGLRGALGAGSLQDVRLALGLLVASGTVSAYHREVFAADRRVLSRLAPPTAAGPGRVLLLGPRDDALVDQVRRATRGRVELWVAPGPDWDVAGALAAVENAGTAQVVVVQGPQGVWSMPAGDRLG